MNLRLTVFLAFCPIALSQTPVATIPLKLDQKRQYWIQARVNDSQPMSCHLDSGGGDRLSLDRDLAVKLGIKATGSGLSGGPQDTKMIVDGRARTTLEVAGIKFADTRVILTTRPDPDYACTIGQTIFRAYIVEVDYQTPALRLYDRKGFHYSGSGRTLPLIMDGANPFVTAVITMPNGKAFQPRVAVDTGCGMALMMLSKSFVDRNDLLHQGAAATPDWHWGYAAGQTKVAAAQLEKMTVGPFDVARPTIHIWQTEGFGGTTGTDGLLCNDFLARFKLIFDYDAKMLTLEPDHVDPTGFV